MFVLLQRERQWISVSSELSRCGQAQFGPMEDLRLIPRQGGERGFIANLPFDAPIKM